MTKKEKRERLAEIDRRLEELYPDAPCALEYGGDGWRLLVMGRLSAQCTDARVNEVSRLLFTKYENARALADANISEVEEIVKPCGLFRMKARNIVDASKMLLEKFGGEIPRDMNSLLMLPGVGRKIANLLLGDLYGMPCVVCDTHCIRICSRLGMYPEKEKNPDKIEKILRELLDLSRGSDFCHRIVIFGREVCVARGQQCDSCPIRELCESYRKTHLKRKTEGGVS